MARGWSRLLLVLLALVAVAPVTLAQQLTNKYTAQRPVIIVGDWDKPPYEFLNDKGQPAGTNIDMMKAVMKKLNLPYRFVLKEWGNALKTFERREADLILANTRRYVDTPYVATQNIINYNRIRVAMKGDTPGSVTMEMLLREGVVLKPDDYTAAYFNGDSLSASKVEFQSPKVALMGLMAGDNKYFAWGEEPLKWKIRELNIKGKGLVLAEVPIPVSEIHVVGRDRELIYEIDDQYSRLKQSGEIARIQNRWLHPELVDDASVWPSVLATLAGLLLAVVFYLTFRLARVRVRRETHHLTELNDMMFKALHMGSFHVMQYDIARDLLTNRYGSLLPEGGISLKEFVDRISPDEQQEFREKMERLMGGRLRRADLNKRWNVGTAEHPVWLSFHGHAIVELDAAGRPYYVINAIHDITHDVEDQQASYELTKRYECLFNMPAISMSFYNREGYLVDLNDSMKTLCGFDDKDVERFWRTVCMFDVPLFRNCYSPDSRDELHACQHMEYTGLGIDHYIEMRIQPVNDAEDQLTGYVISTIDVTGERSHDRSLYQLDKDIQQTYKQINQYEQKLKYLLTNSNMYAWRLDFQQQSLSYTRSLRVPDYVKTFQEYCDLVCADEQPEVRAALANPARLEQPVSLQRHFRKSLFTDAAADCWYVINGIPVRDAGGRLTGGFGLMCDITALHQTQQRLKRETERAENSGKQKSMFLASMTHELRTPLNSIVGFSDLLSTVETPEDRREFIRIIRSNCDILLRLINDILEASSISDGPQSVELSDVDFSPAFDDICQAMAERVQLPTVTFIKDNPYATFPTRLDIGRIQQVATNFVTNAVKYTEQGHIRLGYRYDPPTAAGAGSDESGWLYLYCEDTGTGIPREKQSAIFERFVKLNDFVQGTGLGLSICKSIAESYGGSIGVESSGIGHGSTFWIRIPCQLKTSVEALAPTPMQPQTPTANAD